MSSPSIDPHLIDPRAVAVTKRLAGAGHEAYLVGGCVRDLALGLTPKDYDVATSARPEQVQALFDRSVAVGEKFGVIRVIHAGAEFEVATFRTDADYSDHRRPDKVEYADAKADVERRDFTINGLFYDPSGGESGAGRVIDHVGGMDDLAGGVLRTIGDPRARFAEDHLRMLRAVRFACRFGLRVDEDTRAAFRAMASGAADVSGERVRDELVKTMTGPDPGRGLRMLHETGLLAVILPECEAMAGVAQPLPFHPEGDVLLHTALLLGVLRGPSPTLAMGALLHDIGKPPTFVQGPDRIRFDGHPAAGADLSQKILRRLRFSNEERETIVALVADHLRFNEAMAMRASRLKRFLREPHFTELLELHRADCLASHGDLEIWRFCQARLEEFQAEARAEALRPRPLIGGNDLIALGYRPGPLFRVVLEAVEDEQLEGRLLTKEEAVAWVTKRYRKASSEGDPPCP